VLHFSKEALETVGAQFQGDTVQRLQDSWCLHNPPEGKCVQMHCESKRWLLQSKQLMKEIRECIN
jgi:hypothetical protein